MKEWLLSIFKNVDNPILWLLAAGASGFTSLVGGYDVMVRVLVYFIIADYLTGLIAATVLKKVSSEIGFKGIAKKVLILMIVVLSHQFDVILGFSIIRNAVIFFYIANETVSIGENVKKIGMDLPPIIMQIVELLQRKANPVLPEHQDENEKI